MIALWHDESGFDVLMNWGETREHSLRADGAQIIGAAPKSDLVHLMVAHADGGFEHFLFNLDENGSGELAEKRRHQCSGRIGSGLGQCGLCETTLISLGFGPPRRSSRRGKYPYRTVV